MKLPQWTRVQGLEGRSTGEQIEAARTAHRALCREDPAYRKVNQAFILRLVAAFVVPDALAFLPWLLTLPEGHWAASETFRFGLVAAAAVVSTGTVLALFFYNQAYRNPRITEWLAERGGNWREG